MQRATSPAYRSSHPGVATPRATASSLTSSLASPIALVLAVAAACLLAGCSDAGGSSAKGSASDADSNSNADTPAARSASKGEAMGLAAIDAFIEEQQIDTSAKGWKTRLPKPPKAEFGADDEITWVLETNVGTIRVKLMPQVAPMHVTSTVYLTKLGFYDDVVFHRVIDGFMAQGGDPLGRGTGGPGYQYDGEFDASVRHDKPGLLSMANAGPGTDGSQFFLTFVPTPHLDGKHTIFGEVADEESMKTVRALEARGSRSGRTTEPLVITRATIEAS